MGHGYFCPASWLEQGWRCGSAEYEGRTEESQWRREERQQHLVHGLQQPATTLWKIEEKRREDAGLKMKPSAGKATKSPSYQKGLQAEDGQPKQLTCPGTLGLQTQACLLQQSRWLRRLGGWQEGRHLTMWSQWRAALLRLQTDGLETATEFMFSVFKSLIYLASHILQHSHLMTTYHRILQMRFRQVVTFLFTLVSNWISKCLFVFPIKHFFLCLVCA